VKIVCFVISTIMCMLGMCLIQTGLQICMLNTYFNFLKHIQTVVLNTDS
jgi:hypothetical protein